MAAATAPGNNSSQCDATLLAVSDSKIRAISGILNLCERATINMQREGISNAIKAIIIVCMKFVDKEALFKSVLPNVYIDWDYIKVQTGAVSSSSYSGGTTGGGSSSGMLSSNSSGATSKRNLLGDGQAWLNIMQFLDFGEPKIPDRILQKQYPPLYCMHAAIAASGTGGRLNFNDACKMLVLNNIEGLTSKMMIELHTSTRLNCNTHAICANIVSTLADERHGPEVYESTFKYMLGSLLKVDEASLAQHIAHFKQTSAARIKAWEIKAIQSKICRPSMRKIAAAMMSSAANGGSGSGGGGGGGGASGMMMMATVPGSTSTMRMAGTFDPSAQFSDTASMCATSAVGNTLLGSDGSGVSAITFEQHSSMVRYPNSMSNLRRLRCYLLACQCHHFDYREHLNELVPKDVARALADNPVTIPDAQSLYMAIDSLAMNIRPFDEINQFRTKCFLSFASHQKRNLSLTQVLKLFVAAYQCKPLWKQLWTTIYPVISPQIIRDVETFVTATPFPVKPFLEILRTSSPFSMA